MTFDKKYEGVHYRLSATSLGNGPWQGEAHIRIKNGQEYGSHSIHTAEDFNSDGEAMQAAERLLIALCSSGDLRRDVPAAYETTDSQGAKDQ
ncbi:hypothetical protein D3C81_1052100 [compost metagenome]